LIERLPATVPAQTRTTICHGDYRFGNLMFAPNDTRIVAGLLRRY
jgi:aminoglycoside phosphotransferase (APT) family kinase protein